MTIKANMRALGALPLLLCVPVPASAQQVVMAALQADDMVTPLVQQAPAAVDAVTLEQALSRAYETNPTLRADREGLKILDEDVATARSGGRFNLSAEGVFVRSELDVEGSGSVLGARLSQPFFRGGKVRNTIRAAETNVLAGRESLKQSEIDLLLDVITNYSAVLRDEEIRDLNASMIASLETVRAGEKRRLELGTRTKTDLAQSDARLSGVIASTTNADNRLAESRAAFLRLVGLPAARLAPLPPLPPLPDSRDQALDVALTTSPAIKQAELEERVARYQVDAAKGALLPSIDGSASVARRNEIVQILGRKIRQDLATFQLDVKVPLFQGGAEYAAVRRAKHVASLRRIEIDEATRQIYAEVSTAWDRLVTARRAQEALRNSIAANETALAGVRREALVGSRTTLDILDAEQELRDTRIQYVLSRHDEYVAVYRLLAAMGAIGAEGFNLPVELYRPEAHYKHAAGRWIGFGP